MQLERIQFKQNVFDPKSKGADNVKTFFKVATPEGYSIELDPASGIARVSCQSTGKHVCVHISNAVDFRELASPEADVALAAQAVPKFEAVQLAPGTYQVRPVTPPPATAEAFDGDEETPYVIPPRKRGRPRKQPAA